MILFPNCKINLGLHILRKRSDGFHDLETIFYPVPLFDAIEIVHTEAVEKVQFSSSGTAIDGPASQNSCVQAYELLAKTYDLPAVKMHLHKVIPTGAGLGGGSADGAFTLVLLNKKFNLGLSEHELLDYALQLGSDCPFFIRNKPSLGKGRGEKLEPIGLSLAQYSIVLVNPGIHVNTGWAFGAIQPSEQRKSLEEVCKMPIHEWKNHLVNDFEKPVFEKYPELKSIKDQLDLQGAVYTSMSGSGSTIYGIFEKDKMPSLSFPAHYFVRHI